MILIIIAVVSSCLILIGVTSCVAFLVKRKRSGAAKYNVEVDRVLMSRISMTNEPLVTADDGFYEDINDTSNDYTVMKTEGDDRMNDTSNDYTVMKTEGDDRIVQPNSKELRRSRWFENPTYKMDFGTFGEIEN